MIYKGRGAAKHDHLMVGLLLGDLALWALKWCPLASILIKCSRLLTAPIIILVPIVTVPKLVLLHLCTALFSDPIRCWPPVPFLTSMSSWYPYQLPWRNCTQMDHGASFIHDDRSLTVTHFLRCASHGSWGIHYSWLMSERVLFGTPVAPTSAHHCHPARP